MYFLEIVYKENFSVKIYKKKGLSYLTNCRYYNRMVEDFRRKKTLPKSTLFGNVFLVDLTVKFAIELFSASGTS